MDERRPQVPAAFAWLALDRRGRWRIRGDPVTRPALCALIARHYGADERGRWFFQNGPQRVFVDLEYAPFILSRQGEGLATHTGASVGTLSGAWLDEEGALLLATEHGPGLLADADLPWALERLLEADGGPLDEAALAAALAQASGAPTRLRLRWGGERIPLARLDRSDAPARLGFEPRPR